MSDLVDDLTKLRKALNAACSLAPDDSDETAVFHRRQMFISVGTVAEFLKSVGDEVSANLFVKLGIGLHDLNAGKVVPFLRPARLKAGRPRDLTEKWLIKVNICLAVEALFASGVTIKQAASDIDKAWGADFAGLLGKNARIGSAIPKWVGAFRARNPALYSTALHIYDRDMAILADKGSTLTKQELQEWADAKLSSAKEKAYALIPSIK